MRKFILSDKLVEGLPRRFSDRGSTPLASTKTKVLSKRLDTFFLCEKWLYKGKNRTFDCLKYFSVRQKIMACGDVFRKNSATDSATNIEETAHKMYNSVIGKENGYGKGNKASKRKMEV